MSKYRPDSIQTRGQLEVIQVFYNHLCSLWELYPVTAIELTNYLQNQSKLLHGEEEKKYRYIPKVYYREGEVLVHVHVSIIIPV